MSFNTIIDPATHKIFADLIPEGGGVGLDKGQLITALQNQTEVAFPTVPPANGSVLSYDATTDTGLRYIANNPTALTLDYQQLFSATAGNNITAVPASLHDNYVLTSDTSPANPTGLVWKAVGGSGVIQTNAPLDDAEVANVSTISINYTAVKGEIPAGSGVAKVGVLVPAPAHDKYVLTSDINEASGLKWAPPTGAGGIIDATAPLVDDAGVGTNTISIDFGAVVGQIPYGTGVAKTGTLTNTPANGSQFLGIQGGVPTWKALTDSVVGIAPIVEIVGAGDESQIAIGFGAVVGQIPYGTGAVNTGTLTNTPTAGQILGIQGGVPTWIPAGGSGTITGTFPIVESAGGTNESVISINYSAGVKGEIPAGSGTANTGVFLPPAKDPTGKLVDGWGLQSLQSSPSGMVWVAPTANGTQSIYRSTTATTAVPPPTSTQDTLLLVAEEPNASWDLQPNPTDGTNTPYSIEFLSRTFEYQVVLPDAHNVVYVGEIIYIDSARCVQLSVVIKYQGTTTTKILGHFHRDAYVEDSYVYSFLNPTSNPGASDKFLLSPVVGGSFDFFHQTDGTEVSVVNVAVINAVGCEQDNYVIQPLADPTLDTDIRGWLKTDSPTSGQIGSVNKLLYDNDGAGVIMWIFGDFNSYQQGTNPATFPLGWYSIAYYDTAFGGSASPNGKYGTSAQTVGAGYGVQGTANQAYPNNFSGYIADAWWSGVFQKLYIVGNWGYLTIDTASAFPAPANMGGFAVGNFTLPSGNKWVATPTGGAVPIPQAICLRPSVSQANNLIIANNAPSNVLQFFNTTTGVFTIATGAVPVGQMRTWINSISSGTTDIGFGANPYDFVFYQDIVNLQTEVIWFSTATAFVAQPLIPTPTNVAPDYYPKPTPGNLSSLGIQVQYAPFALVLQLQIAGKDGYYQYDPTIVGTNLVFSGTWFLNGAGYSNANFAVAGLLLGGRSQSYIAQKGLKGWIQVGFETTGLTYS